MNRFVLPLSIAGLLAIPSLANAGSVGSGFTYQGNLSFNGNPANGLYDFSFRLYPAANALFPIGDPVVVDNVDVNDGVFTAAVDFGAPSFNGDERWLSISVRQDGAPGAYTVLTPRQELTPAPHSIISEAIALPLYQTGDTDPAGFLANALFAILQQGSADAIVGTTSGDGAALKGLATADGVGLFARSQNSEAGHFEITNPGNSSSAIYAVHEGSGNAIFANTIGSGAGLRAQSNGTGPAAYVVGMNSFDDSPALHVEREGYASAIFAENSSTGAALEIGSGRIKVTGADIGTTGPVFIHKAVPSNIYEYSTLIDHPMCNGNPDAILIVTVRMTHPGEGTTNSVSPVGVRYDNGHWYIYKLDIEDMNAETKYNVLVVTP